MTQWSTSPWLEGLVPDDYDRDRAAMWKRAIELEAEIFTRLSPEKQQQVKDRIEWVEGKQ